MDSKVCKYAWIQQRSGDVAFLPSEHFPNHNRPDRIICNPLSDAAHALPHFLHVPYISGNVDISHCYRDFPKLISGENAWEPPKETEVNVYYSTCSASLFACAVLSA